MSWLVIGAAVAAGLALVVMGPLFLGRLFCPRLTLALFHRCGGLLSGLLNRIRPGLDLRLLVRAGNRYFRQEFGRTPFSRRVLFLPFCLRPPDCPAGVDPEVGVRCTGDCPDCQLGRLREEARRLGYAAVYVVPSSRLLPGQGLRPSAQFIKDKLAEHAPGAALGVVCDWHLRHRLLGRARVGRQGFRAGGASAALQGVLLKAKNCRRAQVDWEEVSRLMALSETAPAQTTQA
jgi:hypothetical protein